MCKVSAMKTAVLLSILLTSSLRGEMIVSGFFNTDDQVRLFRADVTTAGTFVARSLGYGGDTARAVLSGGFDTVLSLFDASGGLLLSLNNDTTCPPSTPDLGKCWDAELSIPLLPGNYIVALTQYDNFANGPFLADGFFRAGQGNFTPLISGFPGTSFVDAAGNLRTGNWSILFEGANITSVVPEPSAFYLVGLAAAGLLAGSRFRR